MCRQCRALVPARVLEEGGAVYQERLCPACGSSRARIADDVEWYLDRVATPVRCQPARLDATPVRHGCPHDCGPCTFHANACHLPVFSITNACNLACPICFTYNRADRQYFMSRSELRSLLERLLRRTGPLDLVNLTGGEPTLHPDLTGLLEECRRADIGRVTLNTNGLRLATDEDLCRTLRDLGVYVVLSFDTLVGERSVRIHGRDVVAAKCRALENLQRFGIGATLLNVMIRGLNDDEIGRVIALAEDHPVVRSVTVQTMTFTGQGGSRFLPREPMPLDGAARAIERGTGGALQAREFFAHTGAHPLCYSVAYYLRPDVTASAKGVPLRPPAGNLPAEQVATPGCGAEGQDRPLGRWISLTEFLSVDELRGMLGHGYLLQPQAASEDCFRHAIDRLWSEGDRAVVLPVLRRLVERMYPPGRALSSAERQAVAEGSLLAIYLHAHMDEDTLDLARLGVCPDQVPDPEGRLIPACAYNLFYRQKDPRFWCA